MIVLFTIPGEPHGKGRPRFSRAGSYVRTYTPDKTASYENLIRLEFERQCGQVRFPDDAPLKMLISAFHSIPKSTSKKRRTAMLDDEIRPIKKPDADNIFKVIADALNGLAYRDDTQIVEAKVIKHYSDEPHVTVCIIEMNK